MARTLGLHGPLKDWLRRGAGSTGKTKVNYLTMNSETLIKKIRMYLTSTEDGAHLLDAAALTPETMEIDHVNPQCQAGPHHLFNLHLMPGAANAHFNGRHWMDAEKRAYVGSTQIELVKKLMTKLNEFAQEISCEL